METPEQPVQALVGFQILQGNFHFKDNGKITDTITANSNYFSKNMNILFAPLQGYTDLYYQKLHATIYGGADCYYTPFIRIEKEKPRRQDMVRLQAIKAEKIPVVPQIIFRSSEEFGMLVNAVREIGFSKIDLNLGCPYPMQTGKGRGAAMIVNIPEMKLVSKRIIADETCSYSLKMRIGWHSENEWENIIPILNDTPLSHITVHPRIARQMYSGDLFTDQFSRFLDASRNPVIWNGDIRNTDDIRSIESKFPELTAVMIGRGLLARPSLVAEYKSGTEWNRDQRIEKLTAFHDQLLGIYSNHLCGDTQILQKIKPFWDYLEWEIGKRTAKAIRKATTMQKYAAATTQIH